MLTVIFMDYGKNNEAIKRPEMVFLYSIDSSIIIIICPLETLQEKINKKMIE